MKNQTALRWLIPIIGILVLFAAGMGLFYEKEGQPFSYTNHRGETVTINGEGLYYYDTVSSAAQQQGNDLVALAVGLPLLVISARMAFSGSFRGRLLLTGTLGYFLYTYLSMSMLTAYNMLFLVYVVLFSLSLFALILSIMSFNIKELPHRFAPRLPHKTISGFMFLVGGFLLMAWLGRIIAPLLESQTPALENTTTLVIQAMDLGLIVPLAILAGILLLRRKPWGYMLTSLMLLKGITLGLGVSAMAVNMALRGVADEMAIVVPFMLITLISVVLAVILLKNVVDKETSMVEERFITSDEIRS